MPNELSTVLADELNLPSVAEALPADFNRARFVQNTMALISEHEELRRREQSQLIPGLLKGAYLGLDFFNKECYLIPYGKELRFTVDYKGMMKLVKKYSIRPVSEIYARIVREGDEFSEEIVNNEPRINFKPKEFNDGKIKGAFAVCVYKDGGAKVESMSAEQLEQAKRLSQAQTGTAWKFFSDEMYKKIVIRRLCKGIPIEFENATQDAVMNNDEAIETTAVEVGEEANPFD